MNKRPSPLTLLSFFSCILFIFFTYKNWGKLSYAQADLSVIEKGQPLAHLIVEEKNKTYTWSMPVSDLFDGTGKRQINFVYLSVNDFKAFAAGLSTAHFKLKPNGEEVMVEVTPLHDGVVSLALPEKKLYILAPPHMEMAIRALKYEKRDREDIFSCRGDAAFCSSWKVDGFGGFTDIMEKRLLVDTTPREPLPRGRWVSRLFGLSLASTKAQTVDIRVTLATPIVGQKVRVLEPKSAIFTGLYRDELDPEQPGALVGKFIFNIRMPLKKGSNVMKAEFIIVTNKELFLLMEMAGVLTNLEIFPVKDGSSTAAPH